MATFRLPRFLTGISAGLMILGLVSLGSFTMMNSSLSSGSFTGGALASVALLGCAGMNTRTCILLLQSIFKIQTNQLIVFDIF